MDPDHAVQQVLKLVPQHFQQQRYMELVALLSQAIAYTSTLDQATIEMLRKHYRMSPRPAYSRPSDRLPHPKLATLLDYRATVYEKLGAKDKAIHDTRRVIDLEPYNAKGYIRLVKLYRPLSLQRAEELGQAGIRKVLGGATKYKLKVNERNMAILENLVLETSDMLLVSKRKKEQEELVIFQSKKKMKIKQQDTRTMDIFEVFPFEIVESIFSHFRICEILRLLCVSSSWYRSIPKMSIFNTISMKYQTNSKDLLNCFKFVNGKSIQELTLPSMRRSDELKILKLLISGSTVKITRALQLNFLDINLKQIVDLLESKLNNLSSVQILSLQCVIDLNKEYQLLQNLPNLKILSINANSVISSSSLQQTMNKDIFNNLQSLQIIGNTKNKLIFSKLFEWDEETYPNLKILIFKNCNFTKLNTINQHHNFLNKFPNVNKLVFEDNLNYSFPQVLTNINEFKLLQYFQINELSCAKNNIYTNFLNNQQILQNNMEFIFQNLIILDLSHSSIQFHSLVKILSVIRHLQKLNISKCPNLQFRSNILDINNPNIFKFNEIIQYLSDLKTLQLNESINFNDFALTELINSIKSFNGLTNLVNLDLSYNLDISGYKLLDLVKLRPFKLLVINGIDIKPETIKLMEYKYVGKVEWKMNVPQTGFKPIF